MVGGNDFFISEVSISTNKKSLLLVFLVWMNLPGISVTVYSIIAFFKTDLEYLL